MIKCNIQAMRRLYESITIIDTKIQELRNLKEDLFDEHNISKESYRYSKITYPNFLLTDADLGMKDKEYLKKVNNKTTLKLHYYTDFLDLI